MSTKTLQLLLLATFALVTACSDIGTEVGDENCTPEPEVCDGADNDCDGETDEGFAVGEACAIGEGTCAVPGVLACADDGDVQCDATEREPAVELCGDNQDNDCDGDVDEGFETVGNECSVGMGECLRTGNIVCTTDSLDVECDAEIVAPPEEDERTCDGLDNDCDGEIDEGCDDDSDGWCDEGFTAADGGPCTLGEGDCDDANLNVYPGSTIPGCGDNLDNDCDGTVDEWQTFENVEASIQLNMDAEDTVGGPGILFAPLGAGRFCFAGTYLSRSSLLVQIAEMADGALNLTSMGDFSVNEPRLLDIAFQNDACTVLFGVDDGADTHMSMATADLGGTLGSPTDVSQDDLVMAVPWAGAFYPRAGGWNFYGMPTGGSSGRIYRRTAVGTSNSPYDGASVLLQHIAMAEDTTGADLDDLLVANSFGATRVWLADIRTFDIIDAWSDSAAIRFPDVGEIGGTTFQTASVGSDFVVRALGNVNGMSTIDASGSLPSTSTRAYMARHQLVEGPGGALFVIDSAADRVYQMTLPGDGSIMFEEVDISGLPSGSEIVAATSIDGDTMGLLSLVRGPAGASSVDLTAAKVACF